MLENLSSFVGYLETYVTAPYITLINKYVFTFYAVLPNGLYTADSDWQETEPTSHQRGRPTETTQQLSDRK
jgi:hypothetical protein